MKLIKKQRVSASISDSEANLSILGVFQTVQDAVTELLGKMQIDGISVRKLYNALWAFTRNRIKLYRSIPWNDDLFTVTAFISVVTHAKLCVDVSIRNNNDEMCAYSRVEMCALDLSTMRIRRTETVGVDDDRIAQTPEIDIAFSKFDCTDAPLVDTVCVKSTNIDMSQHTNNVEYVRFILNTYTVKELTSKRVSEMEIRYVNQSYENDVLDIYKESLPKKDILLLKNGNKDIVKCEILF